MFRAWMAQIPEDWYEQVLQMAEVGCIEINNLS